MNMKKVLALGVAGLLSLSIAGCGSSTSGSNSENQASSSVITESKTKKQSSEKASSAVSKSSYNVGETFENDNVKVTYDSCEADWTGYTYVKPKDGNKIIRSHFIIENKSNKDIYTGSASFDCYADGTNCSRYYSGDNILETDNIASGRKAEGYVYFEVPASASKIELEYKENLFLKDKVIFNVA